MSTRKTIHAATLASIELQGQTRDTPAVKSWRCGCDRVTEGWWLCGYHEGHEDATDRLQEVGDRLCEAARRMADGHQKSGTHLNGMGIAPARTYWADLAAELNARCDRWEAP